jgi:hypothetical protein
VILAFDCDGPTTADDAWIAIEHYPGEGPPPLLHFFVCGINLDDDELDETNVVTCMDAAQARMIAAALLNGADELDRHLL